eukprot:TRINITY_DN3791_c0_g1_i2.p1 TRINITY_DN3791_c0_g1~~TRINITY_DN3791_c0_g1_i2.p1  ORF type:complete len:836 (+),score=185.46 TRINITY_DN3791_c0_g1_i2:94-2508(+)
MAAARRLPPRAPPPWRCFTWTTPRRRRRPAASARAAAALAALGMVAAAAGTAAPADMGTTFAGDSRPGDAAGGGTEHPSGYPWTGYPAYSSGYPAEPPVHRNPEGDGGGDGSAPDRWDADDLSRDGYYFDDAGSWDVNAADPAPDGLLRARFKVKSRLLRHCDLRQKLLVADGHHVLRFDLTHGTASSTSYAGKCIEVARYLDSHWRPVGCVAWMEQRYTTGGTKLSVHFAHGGARPLSLEFQSYGGQVSGEVRRLLVGLACFADAARVHNNLPQVRVFDPDAVTAAITSVVNTLGDGSTRDPVVKNECNPAKNLRLVSWHWPPPPDHYVHGHGDGSGDDAESDHLTLHFEFIHADTESQRTWVEVLQKKQVLLAADTRILGVPGTLLCQARWQGESAPKPSGGDHMDPVERGFSMDATAHDDDGEPPLWLLCAFAVVAFLFVGVTSLFVWCWHRHMHPKVPLDLEQGGGAAVAHVGLPAGCTPVVPLYVTEAHGHWPRLRGSPLVPQHEPTRGSAGTRSNSAPQGGARSSAPLVPLAHVAAPQNASRDSASDMSLDRSCFGPSTETLPGCNDAVPDNNDAARQQRGGPSNVLVCPPAQGTQPPQSSPVGPQGRPPSGGGLRRSPGQRYQGRPPSAGSLPGLHQVQLALPHGMHPAVGAEHRGMRFVAGPAANYCDATEHTDASSPPAAADDAEREPPPRNGGTVHSSPDEFQAEGGRRGSITRTAEAWASGGEGDEGGGAPSAQGARLKAGGSGSRAGSARSRISAAASDAAAAAAAVFDNNSLCRAFSGGESGSGDEADYTQ